MSEHLSGSSPAAYFEATEREAYGLFSEIALRIGMSDREVLPIAGGQEPVTSTYNPVQIDQDYQGSNGIWHVHLREDVWRSATPRILADRTLPMYVVRSMVVMRSGAEVPFPEEIITRPGIYRSENAGTVTLEVAEAEVAFGGGLFREIALRNQARYMGWLQAVKQHVIK